MIYVKNTASISIANPPLESGCKMAYRINTTINTTRRSIFAEIINVTMRIAELTILLYPKEKPSAMKAESTGRDIGNLPKGKISYHEERKKHKATARDVPIKMANVYFHTHILGDLMLLFFSIIYQHKRKPYIRSS